VEAAVIFPAKSREVDSIYYWILTSRTYAQKSTDSKVLAILPYMIHIRKIPINVGANFP